MNKRIKTRCASIIDILSAHIKDGLSFKKRDSNLSETINK